MPIVTGDLTFKKSLHVVAAGPSNGNTHELEVESLGLGVSSTVLTSGALHDLFDAVSSSEGQDGRVEYRCIYVSNDHPSLTLYDARLFISANTSSPDSLIEIGIDPVAINGEDSSIALVDEADSSNLLVAVIWGEYSSFSSGLLIGNLAAGEQRAVWIKRTINAGATASNETASITFRGDTDA